MTRRGFHLGEDGGAGSAKGNCEGNKIKEETLFRGRWSSQKEEEEHAWRIVLREGGRGRESVCRNNASASPIGRRNWFDECRAVSSPTRGEQRERGGDRRHLRSATRCHTRARS